MKLLPLKAPLVRTYATRLPQKPPHRAPDPLINNAHAAYQSLPEDLTFIHRPPPTAPSPLSYTSSPASPLLKSHASDTGVPLPPTLRTLQAAPERLTTEAIAEMRRLRKEDPATWTRAALAKKFGCTSLFIMKMAPLDKSERRRVLDKRDAEHEDSRSRWGEKKAFFREAARKRKEFW
ncbi:hypothetical protein POSPLADRAFT_1172267 [Postia placenta MAD-698-R-SB12]|uniref:Uncharacterized protein n=1 Tax=Postia placenta MAD-698-R-SB12 TaxID=670580 RepID=A0A1X6MUW0_9APHY|nr:hypothetical protein POSPLADRAFT_1172267 [Postia placenta MAD-698-R-SB12]OSX59983.1 hypothetical protein POSPLADRAFT_1172267 [Postia placenta MAD-698-R-SB12]